MLGHLCHTKLRSRSFPPQCTNKLLWQVHFLFYSLFFGGILILWFLGLKVKEFSKKKSCWVQTIPFYFDNKGLFIEFPDCKVCSWVWTDNTQLWLCNNVWKMTFWRPASSVSWIAMLLLGSKHLMYLKQICWAPCHSVSWMSCDL